jgi:SKIP/SNW domain
MTPLRVTSNTGSCFLVASFTVKAPTAVLQRTSAIVHQVSLLPDCHLMVQVDDTKAEFWQVVPKGPDEAANPHPDRDAVADTMASTMEALSKVVDTKLTAQNPKALDTNTKPGGPTYIKYTPKQASRHHNSGVDHRIIQMQEMPVDPLQPPKFRHQKVPKVPDTTPIPVLHSPPRAVTKEDQANWKIPPCVSAWKNNKVITCRALRTTGGEFQCTAAQPVHHAPAPACAPCIRIK